MHRDTEDAREYEQAANWPQVSGTVIAAESAGDYVRVRYSYSVRGSSYGGSYKVNLPLVPPRSVGAAQALAKAFRETVSEFPTGQKLAIRYNPQRPAESVMFYRE